MADKVPVKGGYNGGSLTGLAEYATGDTLGVAHGGTGLAAVGANQLLTGHNSSTTGALTSESNLTFDGSTLTVAGAADVSGDLTAGTVNADGDTSAGDNAAIGYTAAEGLILTGQGSTSDVTIKNDADTTVLSIPTGTTALQLGVGGATNGLINAAEAMYFNIDSDNNQTDRAFWFGHNANTTSSTNLVKITEDGYIRMAGAGIQFNGDTAAANSLDDYEEGTWTAVWKFGTTANTLGDNAAWYTKIGRTVIAHFRGGLPGAPSGTGNLAISGLPYTSLSTTNFYYGTQIWANRITNIGDGIVVDLGPNSTSAPIQRMASSTSSDITPITNSDCTTGSQVRFTLVYQT
jgi:hypothetical protein